jgi:hypothetical protein
MDTPTGNSGNVLRWLPWIIAVSVAILGFISGAYYFTLKFHVAFAEDQVSIFEQMVTSSNGASDPHRITGFLAYVVNYYPSGSKQIKDTPLDRIVETSRSNAIAKIVIRLKNVTGKGLGDDPQKWMTEYPPSN